MFILDCILDLVVVEFNGFPPRKSNDKDHKFGNCEESSSSRKLDHLEQRTGSTYPSPASNGVKTEARKVTRVSNPGKKKKLILSLFVSIISIIKSGQC